MNWESVSCGTYLYLRGILLATELITNLWKIKQSKLFAGVQLNIGFVWTFKDAYSSVFTFDEPVDRGAYDKTS